MRIQNEDSQVRPYPQNLGQHENHGARLTHPGCAEHGEVFAQHVIDIDIRGYGAVLLQVSDDHHGAAGKAVNRAQLAAAYSDYRIPDCRILGYAALELSRRAGLPDLPDEVELGGRLATMRSGTRRRLQRYFGDDTEQKRIRGLYAEKLADCGAGRVRFRGQGAETDGGLRAADRNNLPDTVAAGECRVVLVQGSPRIQHRLPRIGKDVRGPIVSTAEELGAAEAIWLTLS